MSEATLLGIYCLLVLLVSLFGGSVPLFGRVTHSRLQFYLSLSAGVMLGASFFHVMPEAMDKSGAWFGWWMSLGVVGLFCIERFIAPHSHEVDGGTGHTHEKHFHEHEHKHEGHHEEEHVPHEHVPAALAQKEQRAAAPAVAGWMAVLGLTIHTFMNGLGLAGAVHADFAVTRLAGFAMFLAIALHKPADALAISTVLSRKGVNRRVISLVQFGFALMVPVGVGAFFLIGSALDQDRMKQLTGAALAFSAGTFLFVALSDLLPEVQFHRHDRIPLFLTLAAGVIFMGFVAILEGHEEHEHGSEGSGSVQNHDQGKTDRHHDGQQSDHSDHDTAHEKPRHEDP
jgi:zinc and cadmium transporter